MDIEKIIEPLMEIEATRNHKDLIFELVVIVKLLEVPIEMVKTIIINFKVIKVN